MNVWITINNQWIKVTLTHEGGPFPRSPRGGRAAGCSKNDGDDDNNNNNNDNNKYIIYNIISYHIMSYSIA